MKVLQVWTLAILAVACSVAQAQGKNPALVDPRFAAIEASAPSGARDDLEFLRQRGVRNGWLFSIGYTQAYATPTPEIAGTRIPEGFLALAIAQNEFAAKANGAADEALRLSGGPVSEYVAPCDPDSAAFNWRNEKKISAIESQGSCGSCWAFAASATYDAAYRVLNNLEAPVSEQHILNCATDRDGRKAGTCAGGWYDPVFWWMLTSGAADRKTVPYRAQVNSCSAIAKDSGFRAVSWGYVTVKDSRPSPRELKRTICKYGAASVAVEVTDAFKAYTGGYFNERSDGNVNHAVTLVGWDDHAGGPTKGGWLLKNSWSTDWGRMATCGSTTSRTRSATRPPGSAPLILKRPRQPTPSWRHSMRPHRSCLWPSRL